MNLGDVQPDFVTCATMPRSERSVILNDELCMLWRFPNNWGVMVSLEGNGDDLEMTEAFWSTPRTPIEHVRVHTDNGLDWVPINRGGLLEMLKRVQSYDLR